MPAKPADLFTFLDQLEISYHTAHHPALFTDDQSQALRGQIPGGHSKNLFLKDKKGALFLVVALEDGNRSQNAAAQSGFRTILIWIGGSLARDAGRRTGRGHALRRDQ
jgi:hypothetical protein